MSIAEWREMPKVCVDHGDKCIVFRDRAYSALRDRLRDTAAVLAELGEWDDTLTTRELADLSARARAILARLKEEGLT